MSKKPTFEEQFPGYAIIPEKKNYFAWPLIWLSFATLVIAVPGLILYALSFQRVPMPNMAEINLYTLTKMAAVASAQAKQGNHAEAVKGFSNYFQLGGHDADMMALYAFSLSETGNRDEAVQWARKAVETSPQSKAARMIHDALAGRK